MKRTVVVTTIMLCIVAFGYCDVPKYDIAELDIGGQHYYIKFESRGILKNDNKSYYSYQNEYCCEAEDVIGEVLNDMYDFEFYKQLDKVEFKYFPGIAEHSDSILFILRDPIKLINETFRNKYLILSIQNGCHYGYAYTEELCNDDNTWLKANPLECIFELNDISGMCYIKIFAIKGDLNYDQIIRLKAKLEGFLSRGDLLPPRDELSKLYKKHIIMMGMCSC